MLLLSGRVSINQQSKFVAASAVPVELSTSESGISTLAAGQTDHLGSLTCSEDDGLRAILSQRRTWNRIHWMETKQSVEKKDAFVPNEVSRQQLI